MEYILYRDILKNYKDFTPTNNIGKVLIGKHKKSYLVGPLVTSESDIENFYRRIKSNCIYSINLYKSVNKKKTYKLIAEYGMKLKKGEIIEINKQKIRVHKLIPILGEKYEK